MNVDKSPNRSANFEDEEMENHILEILRLAVFDVQCFN